MSIYWLLRHYETSIIKIVWYKSKELDRTKYIYQKKTLSYTVTIYKGREKKVLFNIYCENN